ncbi:STAS domain-containing protein [Blastococcus sp. URHD0036]|uniref:STAS domain-containing protein n=1 Tax=Blastococcus sp. URHD0036 TaxID=1380356 RepID=UPI000497E6E7|nr:STAS domain-containing protein [Blastococcus sp. URHD0036]
MTTPDLPAEGQSDVPNEGTEAPFDDVITLSTATGEDGVVTVTVVGEVDTFTAPVLRSSLDTQLEQQPRELVIDLSGVQFLGSAGLAVLVETQKSARSRDVELRLVATTRAVTRPLEVTGLIDLFTIVDGSAR